MIENNDSVHAVEDDDSKNYATNSKDNKFVGGNLGSDVGAFALKPKLQNFGQDLKAMTWAQCGVDCKSFVKYLIFPIVGKA